MVEDITKPVSETELPEGPEVDQITVTSGRTSKKSSIRSTESTDAGSGSKGKPKSVRSQKAISPVPSVLLEEEATRYSTVLPYYYQYTYSQGLNLLLLHYQQSMLFMMA